jgi:hypothetical protein
MHFSTPTLLLAATASLASAGQVNFYSDTNCQNYIGERHPGSYTTTGYVYVPSHIPIPLPLPRHNFHSLPTSNPFPLP